MQYECAMITTLSWNLSEYESVQQISGYFIVILKNISPRLFEIKVTLN